MTDTHAPLRPTTPTSRGSTPTPSEYSPQTKPVVERLPATTPNLGDEHLEKLLAFLKSATPDLLAQFPEWSDGKGGVDLEKMRRSLTSKKLEGNVERYAFTWPGKREAEALTYKRTDKTLRPCPEESVNFDSTQNLYIEGDNLDVLKLLRQHYQSKVKMIYIDPPYNTGNDFIYNDTFRTSQADLDTKAEAIDNLGNHFIKNDASRATYHSDWCSMILPRLKLARDLLTEDGVIFISIDDNEVANLRKICDEVFGEENLVTQLTIIVKPEGRQYGNFAKTHEYIIVYARDITYLSTNEIRFADGAFRYADEKGGFNTIGLRNRAVRIFNSTNRPNLRYPFFVNISKKDDYGFSEVSTIPQEGWIEVWASTIDGYESVWRWGKETAEKNKGELVACKGKDEAIRIFKKDRDLTTLPKTVWFEKEFNSITGTREVASLVGKGCFDFPKPLQLLKRCLEIATMQDSLVLDFFSGSATTAHAVMSLNAEDGGTRRFIMVQLPEVTDHKSEAYQAGYKTICEIGKERIRRAGRKLKEETATAAPHLDVGFRVLKLDTSSLNDTALSVAETTQEFANFDRIKGDRSAEDLFFQMLLQAKLELTGTLERFTLEGMEVISMDDGVLLGCLKSGGFMSDAFLTALAQRKPRFAFFREDCFSDSSRTNLEQIFNQLSPETKLFVL